MKHAKKILSIFWALIMIISIIPMSAIIAGAEETATSGTCGENLTWTFDESTGNLTISGTGEMDDFSSSNRPWESYKNSIKRVIVNNGVTTIGERAFSFCTSLTSVTFPYSLTSICNSTFSNCGELTNLTIPNSVTTIGEGAFSECNSLTNVTIPDSVTTIGWVAFGYCNSLTSVTIPDSVTTIDESAFTNCVSLTNITVDSDNKYYSSDEYGVLFNIDKTTLIQYPIGNKRTDYTIPDSVTTIGEGAFVCCNNLTSVTIPNSVTIIDFGTFANCNSLTSVTIPDSVTIIDFSAFYNCNSLKDVYYGGTEEQWNGISIDNTSNLNAPLINATIHFEVGNNRLVSGTCGENLTWTFDETTGTLTILGTGAMDNYVSDNSPWEEYKNDIKQVVINNGVNTIGNGAFSECNSLTSVTIPDSIITIGGYAFDSCYSLTDVIIGEGVTTIGNSSFHCCNSLTSITIPDSVTTIGDNAFGGCISLTSITVDSNNQHYSSDECGVLFNKDKTTLIQYPTGNTKTSYTIPDCITTIGNDAFSACDSLTNVTIPDGVKIIGICAFEDCVSLSSVTIGDSVATIGNGAFGGCISLTNVTIPDGVEIIGKNVFRACFSLTNVTIPDGVKIIGLYAFFDCVSLTSVTIGDNVATIGEGAFYYCTSLESVTIPDSVTTIAEGAFCDCENLTDVYYSGTEAQWNDILIGNYNDPFLNANIHFNYSVCIHTSKTISIPATCTVAGMEYNVCEICGETIGDSTVLPAPGHTAGDWETVLEPTYEADGKKVKKCSVCGDLVEEEIIPMLEKSVVTDEDTGVSMEFDDNDYNGEVEILVEESFDGTAFDVIDTSLNASQKFIYDITMTVDGEITQPNGKVTIRIPLPSGYDPNRSFVYHVDTETGKVEKMPARYENGYMVFETTHFSYYAVVEEYNYTFSIQTPSRTEIRHKDGIKLHANIEGTAPAGSYIEWSADNSKFKTEEINNGNSLKIVSDKNGKTIFTATLYSADGDVLATDTIEMKSKAGFFDKIGSFFRSLFGGTKIYEN